MGKLIHEAGNRYGRLTVFERGPNTKSGSAAWFCNCDCGTTIVVRGFRLRSGRTKDCGCNHIIGRPVIDEMGHRYGRLSVIERAGATENSGNATWLCKCDCGNYAIVTGSSMRTGNTQSCGCLFHEMVAKPKGEGAFNTLHHRLLMQARGRGIEWGLTKEQVKALTQRDCHYCGCKPQQVVRYKWCNGVYVYNGLDRVDSSKGYSLGNVVPCCKTCNVAKNTASGKEFEDWIIQSYYHITGRGEG